MIETIAVGQPRTVHWRGKRVVTSIFKEPVPGPLALRRHNLDGDRQSDLRVHGGEFKAVYAYAAEHYPWWEAELGRRLEPAQFGENLTVRGLDEGAICIGDIFRVGGAELEATLPRLPCYKLGIRFGDPKMVNTFLRAGRWGIYFRVERDGEIDVGDPMIRIHRDPQAIPVYEIARIYLSDRRNRKAVKRLASHRRLDPSWRSYFEELLAGHEDEIGS